MSGVAPCVSRRTPENTCMSSNKNRAETRRAGEPTHPTPTPGRLSQEEHLHGAGVVFRRPRKPRDEGQACCVALATKGRKLMLAGRQTSSA